MMVGVPGKRDRRLEAVTKREARRHQGELLCTFTPPFDEGSAECISTRYDAYLEAVAMLGTGFLLAQEGIQTTLNTSGRIRRRLPMQLLESEEASDDRSEALERSGRARSEDLPNSLVDALHVYLLIDGGHLGE